MKGAWLAVAAIAVALGFGGGLVFEGRREAARAERTIAVAWGDSKYGPAFYRVTVMVDNAHGAGGVRAQVAIGRSADYVQDLGVLGRAESLEAAVRRWGHAEFRDDGLHIGDYFLAREELEKHR